MVAVCDTEKTRSKQNVKFEPWFKTILKTDGKLWFGYVITLYTRKARVFKSKLHVPCDGVASFYSGVLEENYFWDMHFSTIVYNIYALKPTLSQTPINTHNDTQMT